MSAVGMTGFEVWDEDGERGGLGEGCDARWGWRSLVRVRAGLAITPHHGRVNAGVEGLRLSGAGLRARA